MTDRQPPDPTLIVRIRSHWVLLTDEDLQHGLGHREGFLERLKSRYGFSLEQARAQLRAFEEKNPGVVFERY